MVPMSKQRKHWKLPDFRGGIGFERVISYYIQVGCEELLEIVNYRRDKYFPALCVLHEDGSKTATENVVIGQVWTLNRPLNQALQVFG